VADLHTMTVYEQRILSVVEAHTPRSDAMGGVSGFCPECDWVWPCRTYHLAKGWDWHECDEDRWCGHLGVKW